VTEVLKRAGKKEGYNISWHLDCETVRMDDIKAEMRQIGARAIKEVLCYE